MTKPLHVLAFDTSTDQLACAVAQWAPVDSEASLRVLASGDKPCRRHANVELVPTCLELLAQAGLTMEDVDAVLVGRGPGSFTGVRIGIATAKGLACGRNLPLYGASTLDAVAWRAWLGGVRGLVGVVGDAMRGEVYPGLYSLDEKGPQRLFGAETVMKAKAAAVAWGERSDASQIQLTGDGLKKHWEVYRAEGLETALPADLWAPTGESLLRAALVQTLGSGDPALVLPVYTRLSDAEENELKRLGMAEPSSMAVTGCDDELADRHLQVRPMGLNDVEAVALLDAAVFADSPHTPWSAPLFADELAQPGRSWWVAHDQGQLVGVAGGMVVDDAVEILDVAISPSRRREGIATRLLARVTYDAQMLGAQQATLEVLADNHPAIALYQGLGFSSLGQRPDYYGSGQPACIMGAALPLAIGSDDQRPDPTAQTRPWPPVHAPLSPEAQQKVAAEKPLVLAIESSCDETAMSVIGGSGHILANVVATQIDFHARFGGVVPEIASRKHTEAVVGVFEEVMAQAAEALGVERLEATDLSAVGVTQGPGLVGALVVGVAFAKGLAAMAGLSLVGVNHLEGHLYANLFATPDLEPPFVASLVSGGHTMLVHVRDWGDYRLLGQTIDDAVGEAFDKVAKALGLGYPGGPVISRLAAEGDPKAIAFPRAMLHSHDYRFSLSGLKTAVITYIEGENRAGRPIDLPDLAASFQAAVVDVLVAKALTAVDECEVDEFCVGGGVAANPSLRGSYIDRLGEKGVRVTVPPMSACTDNAAMIALVALRDYQAGRTAPLTMDADPSLSLG